MSKYLNNQSNNSVIENIINSSDIPGGLNIMPYLAESVYLSLSEKHGIFRFCIITQEAEMRNGLM